MTPNGESSILRFERVWLEFDERPALIDVSLEIRAGDTCVVFGSAGSGKTVMLKLALGLLKPTSGRIHAFGQDITELTERQLFPIRARMGVLFQEGGLFDSLTIEENVAYPLLNQAARDRMLTGAQIRARVLESLQFVELGHTLEKFPSELSGGMRRRVGIARALVTAPPLLLYDSPTAGLDPITANTIVALIVKGRDLHNTTSVLVTHRYQDGQLLANFRYNPQRGGLEKVARGGAEAETNARFLVFGGGRLVFEGSMKELESSRDPYLARFVRT